MEEPRSSGSLVPHLGVSLNPMPPWLRRLIFFPLLSDRARVLEGTSRGWGWGWLEAAEAGEARQG